MYCRPSFSACARASAEESCPTSSPSGRLLMRGFTPSFARSAISAAVTCGATAKSCSTTVAFMKACFGRRLVRLFPILRRAGLDHQGHREGMGRPDGTLHDLLHQRRHLVGLLDRHLEEQLVMYLEQHARLEASLGERRRHAGHRALDDVRGRALERRIDRLALREGAAGMVAVLDARDHTTPSENRLDIAALATELLHPLHVIADAGEALEIGLDVGSGLRLWNLDLAAQAEGADAVDDAEIDCLGAPARDRVHVLHGDAEHLARGHRVDVVAALKGRLERIDARDVSGETQLYLAVIS